MGMPAAVQVAAAVATLLLGGGGWISGDSID